MSTSSAQPGRTRAEETPMDWVKIFLRGIGQVMFQENALTGLLFLVGIAAAAGEEDAEVRDPDGAGRADRDGPGNALGMARGIRSRRRSAGIYGFNGTLVGIAMFFYFQPTVMAIVLMLLGCAASAVVTWAMRTYLAVPHLHLPVHRHDLGPARRGHAHGPAPGRAAATTDQLQHRHGLHRGPGRGDVPGVDGDVDRVSRGARREQLASRRAWRFWVRSSGRSSGIYHQDPTGPVTIGIYGYNAALAAIALYLWRPSLVIPILGAFLTTPLTEMFPKIHDYIASLNPAALTAPFVFACWIVIAIGALEKYFVEKPA